MIISHKYKCVFIHIPKTAGSFVHELLFQLDGNCINYMIEKECYMTGHLTFSDIKKVEFYEQIKNYTFFTTIRNPIDQLISFYNSVYDVPDFKRRDIYYVIEYYKMSIYEYIVYDHDKNNDPKIIKIPFENLKSKLLDLFKKLDIDTSFTDIESFFNRKINASRNIILNKKMVEDDVEFKNRIMSNKCIMADLYYYNLFLDNSR